MIIRQAVINDASNLAKLIEEVENSSNYMLYEPGERRLSAEKQQKMIEALSEQDNTTILVAEEGEQLVGYLFAIGGNTKRTKHRAYIVVGILSAFRGKGIGTALFQELDRWAINHGVQRLELTVITENIAGVSLYEKVGFKIEGVKNGSLFINGILVDEYYMGKLLIND